MAVDRAYYSIPMNDRSEWSNLLFEMYQYIDLDRLGGGFRAKEVEKLLNELTDEPLILKAEQVYEFRPTEEDDSTVSKVPYGIIYIYARGGQLGVDFAERSYLGMVNGKRRWYTPLPSKLTRKTTRQQLAKIYDLPDDVDVE